MSNLRAVYISDSNGTPITVDKSGNFKIVSELQNAIHDGLAFSYSVNGLALANGGIVSLLFRTGAKQVHFDGLSLDASQAPISIMFYEAPTVTTTGTLQSTRRRNRINTNVSAMTVYLTPTVSANGLQLDTQLIVSASQGNNKVAGTAEIDGGWVLKPSTDYYLLITNSSGAAINYNLQATWHEANYNV